MSEPIVISGLDTATEEVRLAVHKGIVAGLTTLGALGVEQVVKFIRQPANGLPPAVATANLANAIFSEVTPGAMFSRMLVAAGAPADTYVDAVELGARPHMPPVNALLPWVQQKFAVEDEKAALKIAWAIAMSQKSKGMQGRHMFASAQGVIDPQAPSIIERQIALALEAIEASGAAHASA